MQLAGEARLMRLAGFALAARELPSARQMRAREAARHEDAAVAFDDGRNDDEGRARGGHARRLAFVAGRAGRDRRA